MALHELYPKAPIYTSICSPEAREAFAGADIRTSYMQFKPFYKLYKFLPALRMFWFGRLDLREYDIIISCGSAESKNIKRRRAGSKLIGYIYTPTHYYWVRPDEYQEKTGKSGILGWVLKWGLKTMLPIMKRWDYKAAQRPDVVIGISTAVQERIKKFYNRDALLIHPPVDIERFKPIKGEKRSGFVITGRQVPYKRIDLAVAACTELGLPLKVIGNGPEHAKLVSIAGPTIEFLTKVKDVDLPGHLARAEAFIFPGEDDFGIAPVEALASGTPVIALKAGGALDYVRDGENGWFFEEQDASALVKSIRRASRSRDLSRQTCQKTALNFSKESFQSKMLKCCEI